MLAAARSAAAVSAWAGVALKLIPRPSRTFVAGGVSTYPRHGWSQCDRSPKSRSVCSCGSKKGAGLALAGVIGFAVADAEAGARQRRAASAATARRRHRAFRRCCRLHQAKRIDPTTPPEISDRRPDHGEPVAGRCQRPSFGMIRSLPGNPRLERTLMEPTSDRAARWHDTFGPDGDDIPAAVLAAGALAV